MGKGLSDCLPKLVGKLMSAQDADAIVADSAAYVADGYTPAQADKMAAQKALDDITNAGENVLEQIGAARPQGHQAALDFWSRETIRKAGKPGVKAAPAVPAAPAVTLAPPAVAPPVAAEARPAVVPPPLPVAEAPAAAPAAAAPAAVPALSQEAQVAVAGLPENQRARAAQAIAEDTSPEPHEALPKVSEPVAAHESPTLAELSKYGALDEGATMQDVLAKMAADKSQPRWMQVVLGLLSKMGAGEGVSLRIVNRPESNWSGLYNRKTGDMWLNLAHPAPAGLARVLAHELTHHVTMTKLEQSAPLPRGQQEAKEALVKMLEDIRQRPEFAKEYGATSVIEFASEIFSNEKLRAKLNAIKPEGSRFSFSQLIRRLIAKMGFGDAGVAVGGYLDEAMRNVINVAGMERTAVRPGTAALRAERRTTTQRLMEAFPGFSQEILQISTAPLSAQAADAERHALSYERAEDQRSEEQKVKDDATDLAGAVYTEDERTKLEASLAEVIKGNKKLKLTPEEKAGLKEQLEARVRDVRLENGASRGWAQHMIEPVRVKEIKRHKTTGEPIAEVVFKKIAYTYDRDAGGKKYLVRDTPEWEARVEDLAEKGAQDILARVEEGGRNAEIIMEQKGWYREMVGYLREVFGGMSDIMADFLGAFSPITDMEHTWEYSVEVMQKLMRGDYDALMAEYDAWIKSGKTGDDWKDAGKPMITRPGAEEGKEALFGANSIHGMNVILDAWRKIDKGMAPKARNFTANLIGLSMKATIDRWAARFLQRMAHPNYRIPPLTEGTVTGEHMADIGRVDKGFGLGQDIFDRMVEKLKVRDPKVFGDLTSPDLQAIMWFLEKEIWEKNGWTPRRGAANSAIALAAAKGIQRFEAGISRDRKEAPVNTSDQMYHGTQLRNALNSHEHVLAAKVQDTNSMFKGKAERSFDTEWLVFPEYDPQGAIDEVVQMAGTSNQDSAFLSRVLLDDAEDNPNARNGLTVFFKQQATKKEALAITKMLKKMGIDGFTLQVDPRATSTAAGPERFSGVRIQFVPEYTKEEQTEAERKKWNQVFLKAKDALEGYTNVAHANIVRYDTLVLFKGEYDSAGKLTDAAGRERAAVWRGRALDALSQAAARRDQAKAVIERTRAEAKRIEAEADAAEAAAAAARAAALSGGPPQGLAPPVTAPLPAAEEARVTAPLGVEPEAGFYSGIAKIVNRKMPNAASAQQVKAIIKDAPAEDIKWSGINQILDRMAEEGRGKIAKADLLRTLDEESVGLQEVTLGRGEQIFDVVDKDGNTLQSFKTMEEAQRFMEEPSVPSLARIVPTTTAADRDQTRYAQYILPGGENYREVILAMPVTPPRAELYEKESGSGEWFFRLPDGKEVGGFMSRVGAQNAYESMTYTGKYGGYVSSHFPDIPNYVAHMRLNERTDAAGKPGLFIEEIQSDRHQKGREQGYRVEGPKEPYSEWLTRTGRVDSAESIAAYKRETGFESTIPDAPFRKDWSVQMFKRALRDAIAQGKSWIGWTTGETQADRYDLSKQVDEIRATKAADNGLFSITAFKDGQPVVKETDLTPDKVKDVVGKDLGERIVSLERGPTNAVYKGVDLKVGGEGMKGFYDQILPKEIAKYVKQWGGKVEQGNLAYDIERTLYDRPRPERVIPNPQGPGFLLEHSDGSTIGRWLTAEDANRALRDYQKTWDEGPPKGTPIWQVEITPQMAKTVAEKGQALFGATAPLPAEGGLPPPVPMVQTKQDQRNYVPVTVDVERFDKVWREAHPDMYVGPGGTGQAISDRYERFGEWIKGGQAVEMPSVSFDHEGKPQIENGRHRYAWLRDQGHPTLQLSVAKDSAEGFRERFSPTAPPVTETQEAPILKGEEANDPATAPLSAEPVQDDRDVVTAPLTPQAWMTHFMFGKPTDVAGAQYKTQGLGAPGKFSRRIFDAILRSQQNGRASIRRAEFLGKRLDALLQKHFGKDYKKTMTDPEKRRLNLALGTVDNRLSEAQAKAANQLIDRSAQTAYQAEVQKAQGIGDPAVRDAYIARARSVYDAANEATRTLYRQAARSYNITQYLAQRQEILASLPSDLRDTIVEMRDLTDLLSANMLKFRGDGGLSTNILAAIQENIGSYLHRSYDIFTDNKKWVEFIKGVSPRAQQIVANAKVVFERNARLQEARRYAAEQRAAGTPVTRTQALAHARSVDVTNVVENLLDEYLAVGAEDERTRRISLLGGRLPGKTGAAIITERGEVPGAIRELWGEQHDIVTNFTNTYVPMSFFIEQKNIQDQMLEDGLITEANPNGYIWKEGESPGVTYPRGFVELKAGGPATMGRLSGVYVVPELAAAYNEMTTPEFKNAFYTFFRKSVGWALLAKTRLSVVGTMRNFWGNSFIAVANGNFFGSFRDAGKIEWADFWSKGPEEIKQKLLRLTELGVIGESVNRGIIQSLIEDVKVGRTQDPAWQRAFDKIAQATGKTYAIADDFWKVYSFDSELNKLKWAYAPELAGLSEQDRATRTLQLEEQAAQIVRRTTPTYSEAWRLFRGKIGSEVNRYIAPYITFKLEMIRSTIGVFGQAFEDLQNPNARIKTLGAQRLAGVGMAALAMSAIPQLFKWFFGYDDDDEESLRRGLPDWQKNNLLIMGPKVEGKPSYIDFGFMNPYSSFLNPFFSAVHLFSENSGLGVEQASTLAAAGFFREVFTPLMSEQLALQAWTDVWRNQDSRKNRRPLYNAQDSWENKLGAIGERFLSAVSPGVFDSMYRIWQGIPGPDGKAFVTSSGREFDWRAEAFSMAGTKWQVYNPGQGLQSQTAGFESKTKDANRIFSEPFTNRGSVPEGKVYDAYKQTNESRKALYYDMHQKYLGAMNLGMTKAQALQAMEIGYGTEMRAVGLSRNDLDQIVAGKYYRYEPSKAAINDAYVNHRERYNEFIRAYNETPVIQDISQ